MLHTTTGRPHRKGCWSVRACYLAKSWYGRKQSRDHEGLLVVVVANVAGVGGRQEDVDCDIRLIGIYVVNFLLLFSVTY